MILSKRELLKGNFTAVSQPPTQNTAVSDPILHLVQRLTWGPRPEEVAHARAIGYEAFLDEQLNPELIDDGEADGRIRNLPILNMDRHTIHRLTDSEYRSYRALVEGMIMRAVHSKRQLLERMVEFWADSFQCFWRRLHPGNDCLPAGSDSSQCPGPLPRPTHCHG